MILLDTSVLVASFASPRPLLPAFKGTVSSGTRLIISTIVLYEWLRGPRLPFELEDQEALLPGERAVPFGIREAEIAAKLYRHVPRPRGREIDLAIAACAIARDIPLWTLNRADFADIPGLTLAHIH
ncbi:MAG TPA: type II toxin-antitoxin system VapC family toxin [Bryobacteraceae bacterium]|nr:type II toxin-antitoxin system VapC family toxin [Bryobacteraceae bacterium]